MDFSSGRLDTLQRDATAASNGAPEEIRITDEDISRRKEFLKFGAEDAERLRNINTIAEENVNPIVEDLYGHFLASEETRSFFQDPNVLNRVKQLQKKYFRELTQGSYDAAYVENRVKIGSTHERINLMPSTYFGAYCYYLQAVADRLLEAKKEDSLAAFEDFLSLLKLVFLDMGLAVDVYNHAREKTIRRQQSAIQELSTPVLRIRDRLLVLPIVGAIDSRRAQQLTEGLLGAIREHRAMAVVIDVTGVPVVDTAVANNLVNLAQASRLLGSTVIVTGISAKIAEMLVHLGVDLASMITAGDLQGGLEEADRILGFRVTAAGGNGAQPSHG